MSTLLQDPVPAHVPAEACEGLLADHYFALFDWLRSNVEFRRLPLKTIGVTTCVTGAGASTVAWNLAVIAAQCSDERVLLLDISAIGKTLNQQVSFPVFVQGSTESIRSTTVPNLWLLEVDGSDTEEESNARYHNLRDFLRALQNDFGRLIVDLPSAESTHYFGAPELVDGVLLVIEPEETTRESAARAVWRLNHANANLLGVILNKCPQHVAG